MRVLVVSNPLATATTASQRDVLVHALASDAKLEIEETANRGHAAALACRAMRDGVDVVVALGGDGTVNEVVNGLLTDGVHDRVPALGIVPAGSTNVFARALGLPNDPVEATSTLIGALAEDRRREIGLGQADERWFVFAAGLGYDAAVVGAVESQRRRGRRSTHSLYVRTAIRQFFGQDRRHPAITLTAPDGTEIDDLYMALITNCDPWTFLGNRAVSPTPNASFETGLDVYGRTRMGTVGVLWSASRMAHRADDAGPRWRDRRTSRQSTPEDAVTVPGRRPKAVKSKSFGARTEHDLTEFVLTASRPLPFQVDGDALGERASVRFRGVPRALRVCI
ncbi:MAG TPA: diacylglycerol kinase family protein [Jatrophihabitans sp.]